MAGPTRFPGLSILKFSEALDLIGHAGSDRSRSQACKQGSARTSNPLRTLYICQQSSFILLVRTDGVTLLNTDMADQRQILRC